MADLSEQLSRSLSESVLCLLTFGTDKGQIAAGFIEAKQFEPPYDDIASRAIEYRHRYKQAPGKAHIDDLFDHVLCNPKNDQAPLYHRILLSLYKLSQSLNEEYVLNRLTEFARRQKYKSVIYKGGMRIQQGGENVADDIEEILNEAWSFRVNTIDPGISGNETGTLSFLDRKEGNDSFGIGIRELDDRGLVPTRKEVMVFMAARKGGKCIAADELVQLPSGQLIRIEDAVRQRVTFVLALNEQTGKITKARVSGWWDNGRKECYRTTTASGRQIETTKPHWFFVRGCGWVPLSRIKPGDYVAVPQRIAGLGKLVWPKEHLRLLGYYIADGSMRRADFSFTKMYDEVLRADFDRCVRSFGDKPVWHGKIGTVERLSGIKCDRYHPTAVRSWLEKLDLFDKKSAEKRVPACIFKMTDECIAEFLRGLLSCDCEIEEDNIIYSSASPGLARDVQSLLLRLGIVGRIKFWRPRFKGKLLGTYGKVMLSDQTNVLRLLGRVGFLGAKQGQARKVEEWFSGRTIKNYRTRPWSNDVRFEEVTSIERVGRKQTFDLTVDHYHNFIAANLIVHNSWACMHMSKMALLHGWRALDISLEMSQEQKMQRFIQSWFAVPKKAKAYSNTFISLDELGRADGFYREDIEPTIALQEPLVRMKLRAAMDEWGGQLDNYRTKSFPTGALSIGKLEAYLDFLDQIHHFVPDLLIIDYPWLMLKDIRDPRMSYGRNVEELRRIAGERNMALFVPHQANRAGESAKIIQGHHASEDISIIATADLVITYNATAEERRKGLARLFVSQARNDEDRFTIWITQNYGSGQFVLNTAQDQGQDWAAMVAALPLTNHMPEGTAAEGSLE